MSQNSVRMGQLPRAWNDAARSITFCVTEDCNLACKYCYMTGKNTHNKMPFDIARQAVDYILSDRDYFRDEAVVWEFIGGEPFLEIKLIDRISDYIKQQMFIRDHPWFDAYRFNFSTNGLLYHTPRVQKYIEKNLGHVSIGLSVDGNRTKHNLQRVYKDGTGSFDRVAKNVPLWLSQMPDAGTKATFAHDDLIHLKDSVIALWNMGIKMVAANVVFEDVWVEGDDVIFEEQLRNLADYIIEHRLYDEYSVRFFDPHVGNPLTEEDRNANFCGTGNMLAVDCRGDFFPCIRFYDMSLTTRRGRRIGDVYNGIDRDRLRPFHGLTLQNLSSEECVRCEVGKGCAWCSGCNYDYADTDTIFQRATFICKMHKANARANEYFWKRYSAETGRISEKEKLMVRNPAGTVPPERYLYIMTSDGATPYCHYRNLIRSDATMDDSVLSRSLSFCRENNLTPVFLGTPGANSETSTSVSIVAAGTEREPGTSIPVLDNCTTGATRVHGNAILLVDRGHINELGDFFDKLTRVFTRINLILEDVEAWTDDDLTLYEAQLRRVADIIERCHQSNSPVEVNVLTDLWYLTEMCSCGAGEDSFAVAPNGKLYLCPAFYLNNPQDSVGDLETGIHIENPELLEAGKSPYCRICDVYSCRRCKFLNKKLTGELAIPSRIQCLVSHLERRISMRLQHTLVEQGLLRPENAIGPVWFSEPLELLASNNASSWR